MEDGRSAILVSISQDSSPVLSQLLGGPSLFYALTFFAKTLNSHPSTEQSHQVIIIANLGVASITKTQTKILGLYTTTTTT